MQRIYHLTSTTKGGVYNAVGPDYSLKLGEFLAICQQVTGSNAIFRWVPRKILELHGIEPLQELPLWLPSAMQNTFPCLSNRKALADNLCFRSLAETICDI